MTFRLNIKLQATDAKWCKVMQSDAEYTKRSLYMLFVY